MASARLGLATWVVAAAVLAACGGNSDGEISCDVEIGDESKSVSFAPIEGESVETVVQDYSVVFTVLPGSLVQMLVTDNGELARQSQGDLPADLDQMLFQGSGATPNGMLTFDCS